MDPDVEHAGPGWDAIEQAVARVHPGIEPLHYANLSALPDQDGPYGLHAYRVGERWLLVTLGLTELFTKVSEDVVRSGWGIELTMLLPADDAAPPAWAVRLLEKLGNYVDTSARPFGPGHRTDLGASITGDDACRLTALAFVLDPELGSISTPHGEVDFLRAVGLTDEELLAAQATSTADLVATLDQKLVTDPSR